MKTEEENKDQQKAPQFKHVRTQLRIKGLTLFEFNYQTRTLKPATMEDIKTVLKDGRTQTSKRVIMQKDCAYFQALNLKTARKKALNFLLRNTDYAERIAAAAEAEAAEEQPQQ